MEQEITLHSAGSLPGIPGSHAPGTYLVDYEARTIRLKDELSPVEEAPAETAATSEEAE